MTATLFRGVMVLTSSLTCFATAACRQDAATDGYSGVWVLRTDDRPFMILTLEERNGVFTGSLAAPEHWTTSDGVTFAKVGPRSTRKQISSVSQDGQRLHFVIQDPKDPTDADEFDFTLFDADHGSLAYVGVPFDPWVLTRHRGGVPTIPDDWDVLRSYAVNVTRRPGPNPEMTAIFNDDQAARQSSNISDGEWAAISRADAERRRRTKALLDAGRLQAGEDFHNAAFVYQHGETPEDFLLAHTLAMVALAKGYAPARWIATATLDRYLGSIGKPQIYGTQFGAGAEIKHRSFNQTLISDDLRTALGVPPIAEQVTQMRAMEEAGRGKK